MSLSTDMCVSSLQVSSLSSHHLSNCCCRVYCFSMRLLESLIDCLLLNYSEIRRVDVAPPATLLPATTVVIVLDFFILRGESIALNCDSFCVLPSAAAGF